MPDDFSPTPFLWPNYSTGSALDFDWSGRKKSPKKSPAPNNYGLPMETSRVPQLENPGLSVPGASPEVTGGPMQGARPEIMQTPEPVSALDPAFAMHPIMRALAGDSGGGVPVPQQFNSSWMQLPLGQHPLSRSGLAKALGFPGLGWPQQTQGMTLDG